MGRRNTQKKREKRLRQKKKLNEKCKVNTCCSPPIVDSFSGSSSSFSSVPPTDHTFDHHSCYVERSRSHGSCEIDSLTQEESEIYGMDGTVHTFTEDERNNFELDNGTYLNGDELIHYLKRCNRELAYKAELYRKKYVKSEEIGETELACKKN